MTATTVNGLAVIADEPTPSPITTKTGGAVVWHQTRTLLLEDETTVYGCLHCDYTSPNVNSIRPHLSKHTTRKAPAAKAGELSLNALLAKLADLEKITADRDQWRTRAQKAEKSLKTLRDTLKVQP